MSDKRKLYPIVGGGFSVNIKKALISFIYPVDVDTDSVSTTIPDFISGDFREVFIGNPEDAVEGLIPYLVYGEFKEPIITYSIVEGIYLPTFQIAGGLFKDALIYSDGLEDEIVYLSVPTTVSGLIDSPLFYLEAEDSNMIIPAIVSGSLV